MGFEPMTFEVNALLTELSRNEAAEAVFLIKYIHIHLQTSTKQYSAIWVLKMKTFKCVLFFYKSDLNVTFNQSLTNLYLINCLTI